MRSLYSTALIMLLAFGSVQISAKPLTDKSKVDKVSEYFMSQLLAGEVEAAYSLLSAYIGVNLEQFTERGKKAVSDMAKVEQSVGKPISYALLDKQSVADHFYKITYLLKYEAAALIWELNYYQPVKGWKLVDVSFNTNIDSLFK